MTESKHRHRYHSAGHRAGYSFVLVSFVLLFGTVGIHLFENLSYLDSFYQMGMIATGQGPNIFPKTCGGKLFIVFMAFISVGSVIASLGFLFGPFFGILFKIGIERFEEELQVINKRNSKDIKS